MLRIDFTINQIKDLYRYIINFNTLETLARLVLIVAYFLTQSKESQIKCKINLAPLDISKNYLFFYKFFSLSINYKQIIFKLLITVLIYYYFISVIKYKLALGKNKELSRYNKIYSYYKRSLKLLFKLYYLVILNSFLILQRTYTNYYVKSVELQCSFTYKFLTTSQISTFLVLV